MAKQPKTNAPLPEDASIQEFLDMIAPSIIKFSTDYFICGKHLPLCVGLAGIPDFHGRTGDPALSWRKGRRDAAHLYPPCNPA